MSLPSLFKRSKTDSGAAFLRAARAGNLEKVLDFLKNGIDINTCNGNGLNGLHLASKEGHVNVVQELLKRGADVHSSTKKGNTSLHISSLAGKEEVVKILVQNGADINVQSQNGFTPLYMAAQEDHYGVVKFLLANGARQDLGTEDGFTPLAVAVQQGHARVVDVLMEHDTKGKVRLPALHIAAKKDDVKAAALLLQNNNNPDITSKSGFTPLHIAAHYGNENIAHLLISKGADVNFAAKHNITPLHVASKWGMINMVQLLVDRAANIEAKTRDGLTPLHCAARSGHERVVDMLLEKGAPISSKSKNGLAPLHMASQGDHVDSARILLYHKAPVDDVTVDYLTALHVAAHCGHVRVAKMLLDRKADPNARALNGFTPLHIACKKNRLKVVELLLKHGASIEATTESGLTPLHVASFMGCMNIAIYLIQHGANADVPTVRGETPLHLAARANQTDIVRVLLRNGAQVDARAREQQTPLHIAARLGNSDIVVLLFQHGAQVDATTKDLYTALHIAAKESQDEVASVLLEHNASINATTKKGFTPLHLAAKYGSIKVARLLLNKDAPVDAEGKNGVTPLHVASHYDHQAVALLLLDKGASPHAFAKNGYAPLHIAAKKNQLDIATTLLEFGAKPNAESKAGFTPLHLCCQEGHTEMGRLLLEHGADANYQAKNGLTALHLCAQEDRVDTAKAIVQQGADVHAVTKAGYTPLHVASHFGQLNMVRFLLSEGAEVNPVTAAGYTPLHQAAQQGHTLVITLLLEHKASPNATTMGGQTALSIAQRLGYISVVETLKVVTETIVTTTTTTVIEEKYRVQAPETMQEGFISDEEDEGGEDVMDASYGKPTHAQHVYLPYYEGQMLLTRDDGMAGDKSYSYLTTDDIMKGLGGEDSFDVSRDEHQVMEEVFAKRGAKDNYSQLASEFIPDNIEISKPPVITGLTPMSASISSLHSLHSVGSSKSGMWRHRFLVSFMVDARGGAMRGCRHSGVRVIIPPRKAPMPMRITCRYLRREKLVHPPPLMEGESLCSRILEMGPAAAKFLGPVIIEVPHFASLRGREREVTILRSDNGETWKEHSLEASEEAVQEVLNESFDGEELAALEDLNTHRITRILTTEFPQYFAIVTRVRQEIHAIGPEGGIVSSTVVPQVQAVFPQGALTKKIKVGVQAQPVPPDLVAKLLGNRVAVSPIVTVEPRRRKFHKPITLAIPVPQAAQKGMINQYSGESPTLRLLCSITGGTNKAQWEDVTGSTPLTFVNDPQTNSSTVSFTTTVSARFWMMDCMNVNEATKMASQVWKELCHVPFMAKFVVFAKRHAEEEARLRVFCMTDDRENKTLETQEHFTEIAKSKDVEVLEGKPQFLEFGGNLVPVTKSGDQLRLMFEAFRENRLPFTVRIKDINSKPVGRIAFMRDPRAARGEPPQTPVCNLTIEIPEGICPDRSPSESDLLSTTSSKHRFRQTTTYARPDAIHKAELQVADLCQMVGSDWVRLGQRLGLTPQETDDIRLECGSDDVQGATLMIRLWMSREQDRATGNTLEKALKEIGRDDLVSACISNVELVTDDLEQAVAKVRLDQTGFDSFKDEIGRPQSADTTLRRSSLDVSYEERDMIKDSESLDEDHLTTDEGDRSRATNATLSAASPVKDTLLASPDITVIVSEDEHAGDVSMEEPAVTFTEVTSAQASPQPKEEPPKKEPVWKIDESEVNQLISTLEERDGGDGVKATVMTTTKGGGGGVTEIVTTFTRMTSQELATAPRPTPAVDVCVEDVTPSSEPVEEVIEKEVKEEGPPPRKRLSGGDRSRSKDEILEELGERLAGSGSPHPKRRKSPMPPEDQDQGISREDEVVEEPIVAARKEDRYTLASPDIDIDQKGAEEEEEQQQADDGLVEEEEEDTSQQQSYGRYDTYRQPTDEDVPVEDASAVNSRLQQLEAEVDLLQKLQIGDEIFIDGPEEEQRLRENLLDLFRMPDLPLIQSCPLFLKRRGENQEFVLDETSVREFLEEGPAGHTPHTPSGAIPIPYAAGSPSHSLPSSLSSNSSAASDRSHHGTSPKEAGPAPILQTRVISHRQTYEPTSSPPQLMLLGSPDAQNYFDQFANQRSSSGDIPLDLVMEVSEVPGKVSSRLQVLPEEEQFPMEEQSVPNEERLQRSSSYEKIYDKADLRTVPDTDKMDIDQIGDRFDSRTYESADIPLRKASSYETLYDETSERLASEIVQDAIHEAHLLEVSDKGQDSGSPSPVQRDGAAGFHREGVGRHGGDSA